MKIYFLAFGVLFQCLLQGQDFFSKYYTFESSVSNFRTLLVDRDTILLEGIFVDTITPFLQGIAFAKVDSSGNLISYQRYFDPKGRDLTFPPLNNIIKLSDGRYLVPAMSFQDNALLLIFLNSSFKVDTIFEYFANDPSVKVNYLLSVYELNDGYMLFGSAQRLSFASDGQVFRINKKGDLIWRKWFGLENKDEFFGDVIWYSDSTFIISSFHKPFPVSSQNKLENAWIFQINLQGNILNEFVDPDLYSGTSTGLVVDKNKNIYYTGASIIADKFGLHNGLGRIGMLNDHFELEWKIKYGKNLSINTGCTDMILSRGNLIAVGTDVDTFTLSQNNVSRPHLGWTIMANTKGDSLCERTDTATWYSIISTSGSFIAMDTLSSGNIIACGEGRFGPEEHTHDYAWLVKMSNPPCKNLISKNEDPTENIISSLQISPNPAKDQVMIQWSEVTISNADHLLVFDIEGKLKQKVVIQKGSYQTSLNLSGYLPGIYIVQLISERGFLLGLDKFVISQ